MYIGFQSVASGAAVKSSGDVTVPSKATSVEIQAVTNHISYTMDGTTPTDTAGMRLLTTEPPKEFIIDDFKRIKFIQVTGAGVLNCHFIAGRNV